MIYFDHAATTAPDQEVLEVMARAQELFFGNPSSMHSAGRESRVMVGEARVCIAEYLNCRPSEIYFTSGGTEAINTAVFGTLRKQNIRSVITSRLEHHAVLNAVDAASEFYPFSIHYVRHNAKGVIDTAHLAELLSLNDAALVCLMYANNEIGNLLDVEEVSEICQAEGALLLCDMVQAIGKYETDMQKLRPAFACCSAHKFHGPKGVGLLYASRSARFSPLIYGGGQERGQRSGTENIAGIMGLARAFEAAYRQMQHNRDHISVLKKSFVRMLRERFQGIVFNGTCEEGGLYNLVNVSFPDSYHTDMLLQRLDMQGIAVSGGSACNSGAVSRSHVMEALGAGEEMTTLRFSFAKTNTFGELENCISVLESLLTR